VHEVARVLSPRTGHVIRDLIPPARLHTRDSGFQAQLLLHTDPELLLTGDARGHLDPRFKEAELERFEKHDPVVRVKQPVFSEKLDHCLLRHANPAQDAPRNGRDDRGIRRLVERTVHLGREQDGPPPRPGRLLIGPGGMRKPLGRIDVHVAVGLTRKGLAEPNVSERGALVQHDVRIQQRPIRLGGRRPGFHAAGDVIAFRHHPWRPERVKSETVDSRTPRCEEAERRDEEQEMTDRSIGLA